MLVKVKSSEQDINMDRHIVLDCGHTITITFEQLRGNAARKMPKAGGTFDCALCGPEPVKETILQKVPLELKQDEAPKPDVIYNPHGDYDGAIQTTKTHLPGLTGDETLRADLEIFLGVDKMRSKLARIKAILEEE